MFKISLNMLNYKFQLQQKIIFSNIGSKFLQKSNTKSNVENTDLTIGDFIKSTKTKTPTV